VTDRQTEAHVCEQLDHVVTYCYILRDNKIAQFLLSKYLHPYTNLQ